MPTALVTGSAGFLGYHLSASLIRGGYEVVGVDDFSTGVFRNVQDLNAVALDASGSYESIVADVLDASQLSKIIARFDNRPVDVVYHFACPASPKHYQAAPLKTIRIGFYPTDILAMFCARKGARFVFASTSEVYGSPREIHPQPEEYWGNVNPIGVRSCYDEGKRAGEALLMAHRRENPDLDARIVRIFNTYGPRMQPNDGRLIPNFITQALAARPLTIFGDGSQTRSLCYVDDLITGIRTVGDAPRDRIRSVPVYNVGNPDERTVGELADIVRVLVGRETGFESGVQYLPLPQDDPPRRCPSIYHLVMLGWGPEVDLEDGLLETVRWFQKGEGP